MLKQNKNLKPRDLYLSQLIAFQDTEPVKVVTGIRRCGKSSMLKLMQNHLLDTGIRQEQIIAMNFESMEYRKMDVQAFYEYVKGKILPNRKMYLFFDELQRLDRWEDAVNSFRVDFDCDIYITGSNAYLLSSEYSTYLGGRYVEIKMLPLSFKEFLEFHGYEVRDYKAPGGGIKKRAYDSNGEMVQWEDLFEAYVRYGGMPGIADVGLEQDKVLALLDGVYSTIVVRDILEREKRRGQRQITDAVLLRKVILFLADNIGNNTSLNSISNTLVSEKLLEDRVKQGKPATQTLAAYVGALQEAYMFYGVKRFDVKGKAELKTLGKYYIVDVGLRNYLLGYRDVDTGHIIENIVYFELLRRGFDVAIGKVGDKEIDFIATRDDVKIYYQVTDDMTARSTAERELAPLMAVRDNYEKVVIAMSTNSTASVDGIKIVRLIDFLLEH
ncbi:MAG: ATP-binding protein [Acidaminococcaceae bacterium]|nr:ATP-binding protein [Acidaminococcaceae bacterium]